MEKFYQNTSLGKFKLKDVINLDAPPPPKPTTNPTPSTTKPKPQPTR